MKFLPRIRFQLYIGFVTETHNPAEVEQLN
jgi:hypothetical protein